MGQFEQPLGEQRIYFRHAVAGTHHLGGRPAPHSMLPPGVDAFIRGGIGPLAASTRFLLMLQQRSRGQKWPRSRSTGRVRWAGLHDMRRGVRFHRTRIIIKIQRREKQSPGLIWGLPVRKWSYFCTHAYFEYA